MISYYNTAEYHWFDSLGKSWDDPCGIPHILLLMKDTIGYYKGWYFCDELEQINGPFNTFEEAVEHFRRYTP